MSSYSRGFHFAINCWQSIVVRYLVPGPPPCPEVVAVFYIRPVEVPTLFSVEGDAQVERQNTVVGFLTLELSSPFPSSLSVSHHSHTQLPLVRSVPFMSSADICLVFIILFTFNVVFPKKQVYPCARCGFPFHHTRLGRDGLCERCFQSACAASDHFALRGRCIDAFDDGTVDPDEL